MLKKNFITLVSVAAGLVLFGMGMCMCLLPAWNAFHAGIVLGSAGAVVLLATLLVRRRVDGKPPLCLNGKTLLAAVLGTAGALTLGGGMALVMVWQLLIPGVSVGLAGIVLLLLLIPAIKGLR